MQFPDLRSSRKFLLSKLRTAYRHAPIPHAVRSAIRDWVLDVYPRLLTGAAMKSADNPDELRRERYAADGRSVDYVAYSRETLQHPVRANLVAFYLPQFHEIPENNRWWGKGFTEWRNVTRALPQFEGHIQPRLPGDLGFYDLGNADIMREQARLAREYGIGAFCFYFYWFGGKTLLEAPLRNWLADASIDLPFCLCWANEKWSRRWDGRNNDVLIDQRHDPDDDLAFIAYVAEYMRDLRYLRKDGKPILLVYRPGLLPDCIATTTRWRQWCRDNGIGEIHLVYVQSFERPDPAKIGFDAAVSFPPNLCDASSVKHKQRLLNSDYAGEVLDWREMAYSESRRTPKENLYPGVNPGWDNEPRRPGAGRTFLYSSPRRYGAWLEHSIQSRTQYSPSNRFVFINAWNEWAEGAVLEPDARRGFAYLQATRNALQSQHQPKLSPPDVVTVVLHVWFVETLAEIVHSLKQCNLRWHLFVTTVEKHKKEVEFQLSNCDISYEIMICDNRGRDILPFIKAAQVLVARNVDVVLKLHTKRSLHRDDGDAWRRDLVNKLVVNSDPILAAFDRCHDLGLVAPQNNIHPLEFYWGANATTVTHLCARLGVLNVDPARETFISGSMFWARLNSIELLLDAGLSEREFEAEAGQIDGTLAHGVERLFAICAREAGFIVCENHSVGKLN